MHLINKNVLRFRMMTIQRSLLILTSFLAFTASLCHADSSVQTNDSTLPTYTLPTLTVQGQEIANLRPASTYQSIVSNLDFDPRIDFQSRNMAEAQGDINIRGGIFEGTGIQVGAVTLIDPQTGHYSTELPIAPEMLGVPKVQTGASNAFSSFNSTAGTLSYQWSEMLTGNSIILGAGDNQLNFQRIHQAKVQAVSNKSNWRLGHEIEYSRSESDGTIDYSDHDFDRLTGRIQIVRPDSQTDLFAGYQSKFFGQFGMYTGDQYSAYRPYETENIKTRLFILNHQQEYATGSEWEATAYYRRNSDHYIFNRFEPNNTFIHETDIFSLAILGTRYLDSQFSINYSLQLTEDKIKSNTLEEGSFTSRRYYKLSLLPQYLYTLNDQRKLLLKAGLSFDDSNRDTSEFAPIAEISLLTEHENGDSERAYFSYAKTTQVVGYGAIGGSETSGLFRSNHNLLRETSENIEIGYAINKGEWSLESAVFYRWDDDLVDWTYSGAGARSAENVDIETFGLEIIGARQWKQLEAIASYSHLEKSEDYKNPNVVGSFYALNYPKHRATLGMIYSPNRVLEIRLDNEWREHEKNSLRTGVNHALFSYLGISYYPYESKEFELFLTYDKPWKKSFQEIPGTTGRGDQLSLGMSRKW